MSAPERTKVVGKILQGFITGLALLTVTVIALTVLYFISSGKVKTEYIKESQAAEFYERKFEDTDAALKRQREINNNVQKGKDSLEVVALIQSQIIKKLEKDNRILLDSLHKRRYAKGSLSN